MAAARNMKPTAMRNVNFLLHRTTLGSTGSSENPLWPRNPGANLTDEQRSTGTVQTTPGCGTCITDVVLEPSFLDRIPFGLEYPYVQNRFQLLLDDTLACWTTLLSANRQRPLVFVYYRWRTGLEAANHEEPTLSVLSAHQSSDIFTVQTGN